VRSKMGADDNEEIAPFTDKGKPKGPQKASFARTRQALDWSEIFRLCSALVLGVAGSCGVPLCNWFNIEMMVDFSLGGEATLAAASRICPIVAAICGVQACAATLTFYNFRSVQKSQEAKFKQRSFNALLRQDISWFDKENIQGLAVKISTDCSDAAALYGDFCANTWIAFCASSFGFALGFYRGWLLCAICFCTIPPVMWGMKKSSAATVEVAMESQSHFDQAAGLVEETLSSIRTVVSLGHERHTLNEFETIMEDVRKAGVRGSFRRGFFLGGGWNAIFISFTCTAIAGFCFLKYKVHNPMYDQPYTVSDIVIVFLAVFNASIQTGVIPPGFNAMGRAMCAAKRCFDLEDAKPIISRDPPRHPEKRRVCKSIETITFDEIHFGYPARPENKILKGATLTIRAGQRVAFVGESGCGKSTLFALLCRFYDPEIGEVLINGEDMKVYSISSLRSLIGYIGQEPVLFSGSIRDNMELVKPECTKQEILDSLEKTGCWFMSKLPDGIETDVGLGGSMFSGGQKQRIAIARVLIKRPTTILMDEATSALDNTAEQAILEMLNEYSAAMDGKLTTLSIAHRLSTVMGSDVIYYFAKGRVLEHGSHIQLLAKQGAYYKMVEGQAQTKEEESSDSDQEEASSTKKKAELAQFEKSQELRKAADVVEKEAPYKVPMSRVLSYSRPEKKYLYPACIAALLTGSTYPFLGSGLIRTILAYLEPEESEMLKKTLIVIAMYVTCGIVVHVGHVFQFGCMGIIGEAMVKRLRIDMLRSIMRQGIGYHDDPNHSASTLGFKLRVLPNRMSALNDAIACNFASLGSLATGVGYGLYRDWRVSLIISSAIPLIVVLQTAQDAVTKGASQAGQSKESFAAQSFMSQVCQNTRTIQSLSLEDAFKNQYNQLARPPACNVKEQLLMLASAALVGLSMSTIFGMMCVSFWVISRLLVYHGADYVATQEALLCAVWASVGISAASTAIGDAAAAKEACKDMFEILDYPSSINGLEPTGTIPQSTDFGAGNIEFQNVVFAYPFRSEVTVLKGMTFKVPAGASIALVGPSGGGKSTILALIQRFYDPTQGRVFVGRDRLPLTTINVRWWRQQMGFVGQEPVLFNTTVLQNVLYGKRDGVEVSMEKLEEYKKMSACTFIDGPTCNGWETEVGPRGGRLSGGQKQRVAICRALVRDPPLLLLDEATSALDNESERIVSQALETARHGRTSFAIAHRLSTVEECDIILVCAEGVVAEQGDDAQLMIREGIYSQLQSILGKTTYACA